MLWATEAPPATEEATESEGDQGHPAGRTDPQSGSQASPWTWTHSHRAFTELFPVPGAPDPAPTWVPPAQTLTHSDVGLHCPLADALDSRCCSHQAWLGSWSREGNGGKGWKAQVQGWGRGQRSSPSSSPSHSPEPMRAMRSLHWPVCMGGSLPTEGTAQPGTLCPAPQALPGPAQLSDRFRVKASPASDKADG